MYMEKKKIHSFILISLLHRLLMDPKAILKPKIIVPAIILVVIVIVGILVAVFFLRNPTAADDILASMGATTTEASFESRLPPSSIDNHPDTGSTRSFASAVTSPSTTTHHIDQSIHSPESIDSTTIATRIKRRR